MKRLINLIVLLIASQYAHGDITLEYKVLVKDKNTGSIQYQISDNRLRMTESSSPRINLYDSSEKNFYTINRADSSVTTINPKILQRRVEQLNQRRIQKLSQVESELQKKIKTMSSEEQKVGETLLNQLKYPDLYGEHTFLNVQRTNRQKEINGISCQVYSLLRNKERLKELCLATKDQLKLSSKEYATLRSFYQFDYQMLSQIMIAMGKTRFSHLDYQQHNIAGVMIETISFSKDKESSRLTLSNFQHTDIPDKQFTVSGAKN